MNSTSEVTASRGATLIVPSLPKAHSLKIPLVVNLPAFIPPETKCVGLKMANWNSWAASTSSSKSEDSASRLARSKSLSALIPKSQRRSSCLIALTQKPSCSLTTSLRRATPYLSLVICAHTSASDFLPLWFPRSGMNSRKSHAFQTESSTVKSFPNLNNKRPRPATPPPKVTTRKHSPKSGRTSFRLSASAFTITSLTSEGTLCWPFS